MVYPVYIPWMVGKHKTKTTFRQHRDQPLGRHRQQLRPTAELRGAHGLVLPELHGSVPRKGWRCCRCGWGNKRGKKGLETMGKMEVDPRKMGDL